MAIDMSDIGAVLMRTRCDQEVRDRDSVMSSRCELSLSAYRDCERSRVHPQISELGQVLLEELVITSRSGAVQQLEPRHCAQAQLMVFGGTERSPNIGGLVDEE